MNDQLADASNKGLLLDILHYLVALPMWYITRFIMVVNEACIFLAQALLSTARPIYGYNGWLNNFSSALINSWYPALFMLAVMLLGVSFIIISTGMNLQLVRPGAFLRWTLIMLLLVQFGATLYVSTITFVVETPNDIMRQLSTTIPSSSAHVLNAWIGGESYKPFDNEDPDYQARARVFATVEPTGCLQTSTTSNQCATPMYIPRDAVFAAWHATPADVIYGTKNVERTTADGPVIFDGIPPAFDTLFFPDSSQPWYSGSFTNDPNGPQKRRDAMTSASAGTFQAMFGAIFSAATLLPNLSTVTMTISGALLFLMGIFFAPVGLFGKNALWVGVAYKSFFKLAGWQFAISLVSLFFTYFLFGTPNNPGIAFAYPASFIVIPIYMWVHWRAFKFVLGLCWNGFSAVRQVVTGDPSRGMLEEHTSEHSEERVHETGTYTTETEHAHNQVLGAAHHFQPTTMAPTAMVAGGVLDFLAHERTATHAASQPATQAAGGVSLGQAIQTTLAADGDVGMVTQQTGSLGRGTSAAGQYLQWAKTHHVSATDAAAIVNDVHEHGSLNPHTAASLDPMLRDEGKLLAQQFASPAIQPIQPPTPKHTVRNAVIGAAIGAAAFAVAESLAAPTGTDFQVISERSSAFAPTEIAPVAGGSAVLSPPTQVPVDANTAEGIEDVVDGVSYVGRGAFAGVAVGRILQKDDDTHQPEGGQLAVHPISAAPHSEQQPIQHPITTTSPDSVPIVQQSGEAERISTTSHTDTHPVATSVITAVPAPAIGTSSPIHNPVQTVQPSNIGSNERPNVRHNAPPLPEEAADHPSWGERLDAIDHAIEVRAADFQEQSQDSVEGAIDDADYRIANAFGGSEIANALNYDHDNDVDHEFLFAPESPASSVQASPAQSRPTTSARSQQVKTTPTTNAAVTTSAAQGISTQSGPLRAEETASASITPPVQSDGAGRINVVEQPQVAVQETIETPAEVAPAPVSAAPALFTPPAQTSGNAPADLSVTPLDPAIVSWDVVAGTIQHATVDADDPQFPTGLQESSISDYVAQQGDIVLDKDGVTTVRTAGGDVLPLDDYLHQRATSDDVLTARNWLFEQDDVLELRHNGQVVLVDNGTPEGAPITTRDYIAHIAVERQKQTTPI